MTNIPKVILPNLYLAKDRHGIIATLKYCREQRLYMNTLNQNDCLVLIIDLQEKLLNMVKNENIAKNATKLAKAAKILDIPVLITEQYPKGLGSTDEKIKESLSSKVKIVEKCAFSAPDEEGFLEILKSYNKKQVIICGIEAHVCVHQSTADLIEQGYEVYFVADCSASRAQCEFDMGVERMKSNGVKITSLEIVLFELLKTSKHPNFKEIQGLIK